MQDDDQLQARVATLSPAQRMLLAHRLRAARAAGQAAAEPQPRAARLLACVATRDGSDADIDALREFAAERLPDYMLPQQFVVLDALPRSAAGKIDRAALRARDWRTPAPADGGLQAPRGEAESILARIWAEVLGIDEVGVDEDFFELGGDSLLSIRILARANKEGLRISPEDFFAQPTIAAQAAAAGEVTGVQAEQGLVTGKLPLLPIQHWFFERIPVDRQQWNQSVLLDLARPLERSVVERAVQQLLLHHDALRASFQREENGWQQRIVDLDANLPTTHVDLGGKGADETADSIAQLAAELNQGFALDKAPLLRVAMLSAGGTGVERLLIVAHHLVVDAFSWRVLLEDLQSVCSQLNEGSSASLPAKTTSLKQWAARLSEHADSPELGDELAFWQRPVDAADAALPLDIDAAPEANRMASAQTRSAGLDRDATDKLLQDVPAAFHSQINDVLLTALMIAARGWSGRSSLLVDLEGHGREAVFDDIDLSRTVGWLTTVVPLLLEAPDDDDPVEVLKAVKQRLREMPSRGLGYGLLREYAAAGEVLRGMPKPQLCFNFLGQVDKMAARTELFSIAAEDLGPVRSPQGQRAYLIDVNARVSEGCFRLDITYSTAFHHQQTIDRFAQSFVDALGALIQRCAGPSAGAAAPSDFPLAGLDQAGLDGLSELLDDIDDDGS